MSLFPFVIIVEYQSKYLIELVDVHDSNSHSKCEKMALLILAYDMLLIGSADVTFCRLRFESSMKFFSCLWISFKCCYIIITFLWN